ncbi:3-deoxy-manno-octulosonate cytidylyltransferase [Sediminicurvatus halobius]|uniref:3-deoxy-manno-octulosonate cytidylyltransferase n=1 Tax=Sediminicurvatus halobius TaxID=2182432 RepID=A0A2U2N2A0_9GAMM|nr:3-deoxy-manno-octulosonate cytidylyltransferase [Spiribacter halobius]PWG63230.1 3-deoxy-manno-octulosonate cytidylyltransferase [Spiribacter halobius]UEX76699.1 3-deoxy-manno-octulosonate cytidylyltransferase [Spiribacter halobius]
MTAFTVIIPARYGASRLPGKPLRQIAGAPMIRHVWERARESGAERVLVATDDARIADVVSAFGGEARLTSADHASGTDRLAEVAAREALAGESIVVNLQGDEPLMPPTLLAQVAEVLAMAPDAAMATLATPLGDSAELDNPNVVKVVTGTDGRALYFSRAPIPWDRDGAPAERLALARRHLGIYAYRVAFLHRYPGLPATALERLEQLEQLRALANGERIQVADARTSPGPGVDTPEDLERVARLLQAREP